MSTVEVAELTGKQHGHVLRDAEAMLATLKKDRSNFGGIFFDCYGRPQPCLNLPKLECLTLVTGSPATRSSFDTASRDRGLSLRPKRRRVGSDDHSLLGSSFL
ncbi:MAG: Rha family transcriptional regulator [Roseiarcus sp.]|jgi:hypothetical protein